MFLWDHTVVHPYLFLPSSSPNLSAGVHANLSLGRNLPLFIQSPTWGPVKVTLQNKFTLPARTECISPCKVSQINHLGMVSPQGKSRTVSQADNRHIPVRVMNPSNHSLEFTVYQNLAEFIPVSELVSNSPNQTKPFTICTTLKCTCGQIFLFEL